jgi:hypothetical protein
MPEICVSPEARKDLRDIQTYISEKLESPRAALNVVSAIIEKIKSLDLFNNPVGYFTSLGKMLRILLFFSGICSETEVSEQLY